MLLYLKNIGKLSEANVELNGITVIAGENNTGKSTVGKVLYSVFNSYYDIEHQIDTERTQNIARALDIMYRESTNRMTSRVDTEEISKLIIEHSEQYVENNDKLKEDIIGLITQYDDNFVNKNNNEYLDIAIERIFVVLSVSREEILKTIIEKKLNNEFNGQINNIYSESDAIVKLIIKNEEINIKISNHEVNELNNEISLNTESIYIDDPFIVDEFRRFPSAYHTFLEHRNHLKNKLFYNNSNENIIDEIIANKKLDKIFDKINSVCSGDIVRSRMGYDYRRVNSEKALNVKNLSTGLKSFIILKTLLSNGTIEYNGTIILDEPEVHLHPEWQLLFAEIIVLLQKEFNLHILLNTHSPYFLRAIEAYSAKYKIADRCKYYLSENNEQGAIIMDVTTHTEVIYKKLAKPLEALQIMRFEND